MNKTAGNFYDDLQRAKTLNELKAVYKQFADAFCENQITRQQFHELRIAFHNRRICAI